ncbi:MAG TPA: hypothetical protein VM370_06005 [Candidatus Thermoplasmatota archaeon]|nr:hypothetical protein [Candidatus Thermoplasmatota archaeon]
MRAIVVLLVHLVLFAGCVGQGGPPGPADDGTSAPVTATPVRYIWNATGCREITATFDVSTAALQAELPEGFTARPSRTPGRSGVGVDFFECAQSVLTSGPTEGGAYASFWAGVDAPAALMGNATDAFVKWDTLIPDPVAFAALSSAKASVRTGSVTVRDATPAGGIAGEIAFDELGSFVATALAGVAPPGATGGSTLLREWSSAGEDGSELAMWEVNLTQYGSSFAPGTLTVPADSIAAKLYGGTTIPSLMGWGDADLRDGFMELHARTPGDVA